LAKRRGTSTTLFSGTQSNWSCSSTVWLMGGPWVT
jgi:hypothetical protein